jgi:hypothetical protein
MAKVDFDLLFKNVLDAKNFPSTEQKPPQFRLSSSPFCPYSFIFSWVEFLDKGNSWDYHADFYTGQGTAIHSALQHWIPRINPGLILGNWRCVKCNTYYQACVGPKICPKCSSYMTYEEFHYIVKPCVSGHSDGILLAGDFYKVLEDMEITESNTCLVDKYIRKAKNPIPAYILEYKSGSRNKVGNITQPQPGHKAQASMYVIPAQRLLDSLGLKIKLKGAIIKYFARDISTIRSNDLVIPLEDDSYFRHNMKIIRSVYSAVKENDYSLLIPDKLPCTGKFEEYYSKCTYHMSCKDLRKKANVKEFFEVVQPHIKKDFQRFRKEFKTKLENS